MSSQQFLIRAMAVSRATAIQKLFGLEHVVHIHILKCLLHPDSTSKPGWIRELAAWFSTIESMRLKTNGKKLSVTLLAELNYLNVDLQILENALYHPKMEAYLPSSLLTKNEYSEKEVEALALKLKPEFDRVLHHMVSFILKTEKVTPPQISKEWTSVFNS